MKAREKMTKKVLTYSNGNHISYTISYGEKKRGILYLHGLLSSQKSNKGCQLFEYAQENNLTFLSLDYTAHGESSGKPEEFRIGQCLTDICNVIRHENYKESFIIVGSSLGGWLSFLIAEKYPNQVKGILTLAAGVDFMPRIWNEIFDDTIRQLLKTGRVIGPSADTMGYCFSYPMFEDAEKYLLLKRSIHYTGPVMLIHGDKDEIVPWKTSLAVKEALDSKDVVLQLIKGEKHPLKTYDLKQGIDTFVRRIGILGND